jgi:L-rhamnose mutarotase
VIRRAFRMRLKPGGLAEYKRNHDEIWPDLVAEIEKAGIAQITIFENDPDLVLYSQITHESAWDELWATEVHQRWGALMEQFIEIGEGGAPVFEELGEVWHLGG